MGPVQLTAEQFQELLGRLTVNNAPPGNNAEPTTSAVKVKPERPSIDIDTTESEWLVFKDNWSRFKRMSKITSRTDIIDNLRQCCTSQLNRRLFDMKGPVTLDGASEDDLLLWMKEVAVKGLHTEVHRTQFVNLKQKQGELTNSFLARLKSKATLCDFHAQTPTQCNVDTCACTNHGMSISYEDDMVATQLVAGIYNNDHQVKVLSESSNLISLDDKVKRLLILEKSDASLSSLSSVDGFANEVSVKKPFRSGTKGIISKNSDRMKYDGVEICRECNKKHKKCEICGGFHKCTTRCNLCKRMGHIRNCCTENKSAAVSSTEVSLGGMDDEISFSLGTFGLEDSSDNTIGASFMLTTELLHHMEYIHEKFQKMMYDVPVLNVSCQLLTDSFQRYGKYMNLEGKGADVSISCECLADTGAQVCTAGRGLLQSLGIDESHLVPTTMKVKGVTHSSMTVLGAVFLEVSAKGRCTNQVVYVASEARRLILSEKALRDLGVIPDSFPTPGMFPERTIEAKSHSLQEVRRSDIKNKCGCLKRAEVPPLPASIPLEPTLANRDKLENWILQYYASSAFNICEHQCIPGMTGPDMVINIDADATPKAIHSPIPVPHHWKKEVKSGLDRDCKLGVIEPVPAGTPTTWCSRMVVTSKSDGSPRRVVDLQALNAVSKRETHHTASPWNQASSVPKNMKKTVLDAWNGYHSIPLSSDSREKTTFITEWGRYRHRMAPQGHSTSGDAYTKRFDDITIDVPNKTRCVDDTLLYETLIRDSFWTTCQYIDLCARNGIIFNPKKFKFGRDVVDFAGFTLTEDSIKPTAAIIQSIAEFPMPTSLTQARSWFGLVNQVTYTFAQSQVMAPFRDMLKKNTRFYWDSALEALFLESRKKIVEMIKEGVTMYEMGRPTCLATDFSKTGIGYFLLQKYCDCATDDGPNCGPGHWKLVFAGSRFLKDYETRYAPIEGEALAVAYGLEQTRMYILGCPDLLLAVDHKPLVPLLNDKRLDQISNPKLFSFKEKTLLYRFRAKHVPGSLHLAADAASRNPAGKAHIMSVIHNCNTDDIYMDLEEGFIRSIEANQLHSANDTVSWDEVKIEAAKDAICMSLCEAIKDGFPGKKSVAPEFLRKFYKLKDELHSIDEVPFLNSRMYIPATLRRRVLAILHAAHQGVAGMKAAARGRFWWFGMDADIDQKRSQCKECNGMAPSNIKEPLTECQEPEYPWQLVVMDYFNLAGVNYLVIADRYTGWPEIHKLNGKAMTLIKTCRNMFAQYGVPEEISTDGGPPFQSSEWSQFLKQWDIRHRLSSGYYPQSNGRAELAVKSAKRMLRDNVGAGGSLDTAKVTIALLQYRNTPIAGIGMSPAFILYGRQLKDALPSQPGRWNSMTMSYSEKYGSPVSNVWKEVQAGREIGASKRLRKMVDSYNTGKKPLASLSVGDCVAIQNRRGPHPLRWDTTGRVVERLAHRQYMVKCDGSGRVVLRNRGHLRKISPSTAERSAYDDGIAQKVVDGDGIGIAPLHIPGRLGNGLEIIEPIEQSVESPVSVAPPAEPLILNPDRDATGGHELPTRDEHSGRGEPQSLSDIDIVTDTPDTVIRRSTRTRKPPKFLAPVMHGKRHLEK